jgi:hypothetical protein
MQVRFEIAAWVFGHFKLPVSSSMGLLCTVETPELLHDIALILIFIYTVSQCTVPTPTYLCSFPVVQLHAY